MLPRALLPKDSLPELLIGLSLRVYILGATHLQSLLVARKLLAQILEEKSAIDTSLFGKAKDTKGKKKSKTIFLISNHFELYKIFV